MSGLPHASSRAAMLAPRAFPHTAASAALSYRSYRHGKTLRLRPVAEPDREIHVWLSNRQMKRTLEKGKNLRKIDVKMSQGTDDFGKLVVSADRRGIVSAATDHGDCRNSRRDHVD
ncbi:hypothetical protein HAX54_047219 [Datura stramonium]|uniref:Uncharacterized protein n=1 Tax=Datura stramonium TaxID=4076 RepID=A0ABS8WKB1_DATST|nr:hypothetical protein [Datura stramonium]